MILYGCITTVGWRCRVDINGMWSWTLSRLEHTVMWRVACNNVSSALCAVVDRLVLMIIIRLVLMHYMMVLVLVRSRN